MVAVKLVVIIIMFTGLVCSFSPKVPGAIIILTGAIIYGLFTEFRQFGIEIMTWLVSFMVLAEFGVRWLRIYLTRHYSLALSYCVNTIVGSIAGLIVSEILLGTIIGTVMWEIATGKAWMPNIHKVATNLIWLAITAMVRIGSCIMMVIIIFKYLLN